MIPDTISGKELADTLRQAALQRGVRLNEFLRPLGKSQSWLRELNHAARPTAHTIGRARALLEGREVPPPLTYTGAHRRMEPAHLREPAIYLGAGRIDPGPALADRPRRTVGDRPIRRQRDPSRGAADRLVHRNLLRAPTRGQADAATANRVHSRSGSIHRDRSRLGRQRDVVTGRVSLR